MAEQITSNDTPSIGLARALAIPLVSLLSAPALGYIGSPTGNSAFPEVVGRGYLSSGLRTIAILFGLSCFPGVLIGSAFGYLTLQNRTLASAALKILRIGQWAPFVIWWVLVQLLLVPPGQQPGRYFFVWTMSIPAVALGNCYEFLRTRHLTQR